jgi:DNA polymerase-1
MKFEAEPRNYVLIDADNVAYRAYYAFPELCTKEGLLTGCFYGFFSMLLRKIQQYNPYEVKVCWSDKRSDLLRRILSPRYKDDRGETPKVFIEQCEDIKLALHLLNIPQYLSFGYEADDLIGMWSKILIERSDAIFPGQNRKVYIISNDKDLLQLVNERVLVIRSEGGGFKNEVTFDEKKVEEKFGIPSTLLSDYLALSGDSGDRVIGVPGIGPKTAVLLLLKYGGIDSWIDAIEGLDITKNVKDKLLKGKDSLELSKKLVDLTNLDIPIQEICYEDAVKEKIVVDEIFDAYSMTQIRPYMFLGFPND